MLNIMGIVKITKYFTNIIRHYSTATSSALYLTGRQAQTTYAVVKPQLDLDDRIAKENLEENIQLRGLKVDLKRLVNFWNMYRAMEEEKVILEVTRREIGKIMTKLLAEEDKYRQDIAQLKTKAKLLKNDFLNVRDYAYGLEETVAYHILGLPNVLHPITPKNEPNVIHTFSEKLDFKSKSHMEIAKEKKLIEYINPMLYYLTGDAAIFEVGLVNYFTADLNKNDFMPFSNPDFSRSVVVEGCGTDFSDYRKVFTLEDPHDEKPQELCRLHLTGCGSIYPFMAYFTKHSVQKSYFPLKLFSEGRIYTPVENDIVSLMSLSQYTAVTAFLATLDDDESLNKVFEEIQLQVIRLYEGLGYHFRIAALPAKQLSKAESLRLSIQMYSNHLSDYCEVGNISVYDSYLSKRLLFTYSENKDRKYPKIISGCILNAQKFLASVLENNTKDNKPLLTDIVKSYV